MAGTTSSRTGADATGLAARLRDVATRLGSRTLTLDELIEALGPGSLALILVLFAAVTLIPGIAPAFGVALCLIGVNLIAAGDRLWLPDWLGRRTVPGHLLARGLDRLAPRLDWIEQRMRPRRPEFLDGVWRRAAGVAVLLCGLLIVLPIPFGNTLPALAALGIAVALAVRDGLMLVAGLAFAAVALLADTALIVLGWKALAGLFHFVF